MLALVSDTGILVAVIAFVALFGASQIPKLARNLGEAGREFRKAHAEMTPSTPAVSPVPPSPVGSDERITLSRAQLDALLAQPSTPADERG
jgi:TatA/E family protein of Tat protein translocase